MLPVPMIVILPVFLLLSSQAPASTYRLPFFEAGGNVLLQRSHSFCLGHMLRCIRRDGDDRSDHCVVSERIHPAEAIFPLRHKLGSDLIWDRIKRDSLDG